MTEEQDAPQQVIHFKHCIVHVWNNEFLETVFEDGRICPALFTVNDDTRKTARELGYGDADHEVRQMHYEHELAHTFLAEAMGHPYSLCLRRVSLDIPWTFDVLRDLEERVTLAFAKFLHTGHYDDCLKIFDDQRLVDLIDEFRSRFGIS